MKTHILKIKDCYYDRLFRGEKKAEIRFNDRDFQTGDIIKFDVLFENENVSDDYIKLAKWTEWKITHILSGYSEGLKEGYCILSIKQSLKPLI